MVWAERPGWRSIRTGFDFVTKASLRWRVRWAERQGVLRSPDRRERSIATIAVSVQAGNLERLLGRNQLDVPRRGSRRCIGCFRRKQFARRVGGVLRWRLTLH